MFAISSNTVLRPEPQGALLFQQKTAETVLLDLKGLEALYWLCSPKPKSESAPFFTKYLVDKGFIVPRTGVDSGDLVEQCLEQAKLATAPLRSLVAPETIHFSVTGRCDQGCAGCFYSVRPGSDALGEDASWTLFEKVVLEARKAKVFQIALGGGEPLLHPRITDMVALARSHRPGLVPNLTTNGNLLTRDLAFALKEAGLGQIQISLNGSTEATNADTRPNFRQAVEALEICRDVDLRFGINILLTKGNLSELEAVVKLGRHLGAASVNILRPKPPATEEDWLQRESLDATGYRKLQRMLRRLRASAPKLWARGAHKGATRITVDASLTFLLTNNSPEQLYRNGVWGCCAARKFVTILPDGAVLPCSHVRWSDVGEGEFMKAWRRSQIFSEFRRQEEIMRGHCRSCPHLKLCKGCRAVVMAFGGDFRDSDPHCPLHVENPN